MPDGKNVNENPASKEYYHELLDKLAENGIDAIVTLYAYDLPLELQIDLDKEPEGGSDDEVWDECIGWVCYEIIDYFTTYAAYAFEEFGDKVKDWITLTEPAVFSDAGYADCTMPPANPKICEAPAPEGQKGKNAGDFEKNVFASRTARHNALQAHVSAYRHFKVNFSKLFLSFLYFSTISWNPLISQYLLKIF